MSKLFADASAIAITSFISPYAADRQFARSIHDASSIPFVEVFVDAPLSVVEQRDPKGLYKKARAGEIKGQSLCFTGFGRQLTHSVHPDFTGISAPYEAPASPEIHIPTADLDVAQSVELIAKYLQDKGFI